MPTLRSRRHILTALLVALAAVLLANPFFGVPEQEALDADQIAAVFSRVPKWRRLREGIGAIEPALGGTSSQVVA